jgi:saccharopine dehydrogenase (NADP+, L-glutamate forming)
MKKVLILGAGMVAKPIIDYLLDSGNFHVMVATRTVSKAEKILKNRPNTESLTLLVDNDRELENAIKRADLVVSLLPYTYHVKTARYCLKHHLPLVTTSYVSPQMQELDEEARRQNIIILNEIGLDPGIDHMSAMRIIHNVHSRGGKIHSFCSYCGGLPAPEANTNPWGYKFSWSPRGVLMAGRNPAKFLRAGKMVEIEGRDLFQNRWPITIDGLQLETYPNRNSLPYIPLYGMQEAQTAYRGTLRYPGWCRTLYAVSQLNLLSDNEIGTDGKLTRAEIAQKIFGTTDDPRKYISTAMNIPVDDEIIRKLEWLDLFSKQVYEKERTTPIDFLSDLMLRKMQYETGERDLIVLHHDFWADFGGHQEHITSTLVDYGIPHGDSAMSRTVSLPAAIAVKLILEGKITEKGVRIPVDAEIYRPVLDELERLGIVCREKSERHSGIKPVVIENEMSS